MKPNSIQFLCSGKLLPMPLAFLVSVFLEQQVLFDLRAFCLNI